MSRIVLVEDHPRLADLICKALTASGIQVDVYGRIDGAWEALRA